ncbi:MAG: GTPase HflX [Acidimicrobiales bacterium]|jgi:GTP-binding protein HflX|nr:GTPase HflX [Acidimicrobiales bacterium]MDP6240252.1 GTPase HflX [Acidimicrobiales bacterium]MDP7125356.1 GTPase HflX [Acidimicrobiales bacterium]MDP7352498.1 GTPase HflX [Acidimicrobiales bacterium]MDP7507360.1 GTPase HflX [Acidimicrobiales bacterium]|tara:strand:+ start:6006 stop:7397 length:1392 start_codon:yes stop_codon:yes gene_type:complete
MGDDLPEEPIGVDAEPADGASHRGAFGEFGGASRGLIDRAFRERIVLAGVALGREDPDEVDASMDELARLVDTAGADPVARMLQHRDAPDIATYVGSGKAVEIRDLSQQHDADTVVFDNELTPAQQGNLETILKRSALDRTAVILDIFAQNASSLAGRTQVELAQLRYRLPRLRRSGRTFSQQAGGIGTRGPGETQLEVDRRRIMRRIRKLEKDLVGVRQNRATQSKRRRRTSNRSVAIVGYTNAGKSTLLNRMTDAGVLVEDRLFATLDATTRRLELPGGEAVFLTDTVGFVRKLPHQLVEAFRTTLDVVVDADLLVHVVDSSALDPFGDIDAVRGVLREIGAEDVPELYAFNKADTDPVAAARLAAREEGAVAVSAVTGEGIEDLLAAIGRRLRSSARVVSLVVPFDRGDALAMAHREGEVLDESSDEHGWRLRVRLDEGSVGRLAEFAEEGGGPIVLDSP